MGMQKEQNLTFRLAQVGTFDLENYGDLLFPVVLENELRQRIESVEIDLFSPCGGNMPFGDKDVYPIQELENRVCSAHYDAIVVGGGDIVRIDNQLNTDRDKYNMDIGAWQLWLIPVMVAIKHDIPVLLNAPGVPFSLAMIDRELLKAIILSISYLSVRDSTSAQLLFEATDIMPKVVPDSVFVIDRCFPKNVLDERFISLSEKLKLPEKYIVFQANGIEKGIGNQEYHAVLSGLEKDMGAQVIFMPIGYVHEDRECMMKLNHSFDEPFMFIEEKLSPPDMLAVISHAQGFVGTSMHGSVTAQVYRIPTIAINSNGLVKVTGTYGVMKLPGSIVNSIRKVEAKRFGLMSEFVRKENAQKINQHFDDMSGIITGEIKKDIRKLDLGKIVYTALVARQSELIVSKLYFDYGNGFSEADSKVIDSLAEDEMDFSVLETIDDNVKIFRFDPVESGACAVKLMHVDMNGVAIQEWTHNGHAIGDFIYFNTDDPMICFQLPDGKDRKLSLRALLYFPSDVLFNIVANEIMKLEQANIFLQEKDDVSIPMSVFFQEKGCYSDKNVVVIENTGKCDTRITLSEDVKIPSGCRKVRIDPEEGYPCIVEDVKLAYFGKRVNAVPINGFQLDDFFFFPTEDPQLEVELPNADGLTLHINMTLRLYDVRDMTLDAVRRKIEADREVADALNDKLEASLQELDAQARAREAEIDAMRQSYEAEVDTMRQSHEAEIDAMRQSYEAEVDTMRQSHEAEVDAMKQSHEAEVDAMEEGCLEQIEELKDNQAKVLQQIQASYEAQIEEKDESIGAKDKYIGEVVMLCNERLEQIEKLTATVEALQGTNRQLSERCNIAEQNYAVVSNAFFWKITKPARTVMDGIKKVAKLNPHIYMMLKSAKATLHYGPKKARVMMRAYKAEMSRANTAISWPTEEELQAQRKTVFNRQVKFSVLVPLYNTPLNFLSAMIESVQAQSYENWELCLADGSDAEHTDVGRECKKYARKDKRIKYKKLKKNLGISGNTNACIEMSSGDYIVLFDHDDLLHPSALFEVMKAICEKKADFIYTDENTFHNTPDDAFNPHYKPDYAPDNLRANNYICHLTTFDKNLLTKSGGGFRTECDGSQDFDMVLRLTEQAKTVIHIPKVLYYWRAHEGSVAEAVTAKPYVIDAAKKAIRDHLQRVGLKGEVLDTVVPSMYRLKYEIEGNPLVSIIIPNYDHVDDLKRCIDSILEKTSYENFEIIIVENNSIQQQTFEYYSELEEKYLNIRVVTWKGKFNYSAINNYGFSFTKGEHIILLNNDTEIISEDWIQEMLMYSQRSDVGAVGAKLYYPDHTIQHAGIGIGLLTLAGHYHKHFDGNHPGYMGRLIYAQDVSAVTGACVMFPRHVYEKVNGLDESFEVAFNDVDICMRIRKLGYLIVFTPYAELYHYESKSRGLDESPEKRKRFISEVSRFQKRWKKELEAGDPYYNPNFSLDSEDFSVKG